MRSCFDHWVVIACASMHQAALLVPYLEHQALLSPVWQWELNLSVQAARAQQSRVKGVGTVGGHNDLAPPHHTPQQSSRPAVQLNPRPGSRCLNATSRHDDDDDNDNTLS
jgi:hypothetical protein